jgi:prephenate dehydrogenase
VTLPDIAIVGGGLLGRLLAWRASSAGAAGCPLRCSQQSRRRLSRMDGGWDDYSFGGSR